jgi:hypothetical protein
LKRGLKVREIAKREAIGLSIGVPPIRVSCGCKGVRRGLVYTDSSAHHEAFVDALLLGRARQHRFACVGDRRAGEWKAAYGWLNALVDFFWSPGGPR